MKPLQKALALAHAAGFTEAEFYRRADVAFVSGGVVYIGPDAVLIADDEGDTWFLWCAVGDPRRLFALAPEPKEFISWARAHRGRSERITVPWHRVQSLITHGRKKQDPDNDHQHGGAPAGHSVNGAVACH